MPASLHIPILGDSVLTCNLTPASLQGSDRPGLAKHGEKQSHSGEKTNDLPGVEVGKLPGSSHQAP